MFEIPFTEGNCKLIEGCFLLQANKNRADLEKE